MVLHLGFHVKCTANQHQDISTVYDMVISLKELFGDQSCAAKQVSMRELMNTNMAEGTPVRNHILNMMSHLNELEILGAEIDEKIQVDVILQYLAKSFT